MAGAPIDKGAGIRVLKKIGDRVEKGEPIYRIHAFEHSEYELAVGAAKMQCRLPDRRRIRRRRDRAVTRSSFIACRRPSRDAAAARRSRLGIAISRNRDPRFPGRRTARDRSARLRPTTSSMPRSTGPNDKLMALLFAAESLRRNGARRLVLVAPYLCYMRQDTAFHPGEAISQKVIGQLIAASFDRVITVDAHLHRTPDIERRLSRHRGRQPVRHAGHRDASARRLVLTRDRSLSVRMPNRALGERARHPARRCHAPLPERPAAAIARWKLHLDDPHAFAGRPALLVDDIVSSGGTMHGLRQGRSLRPAPPRSTPIVTHALFPPELASRNSRRPASAPSAPPQRAAFRPTPSRSTSFSSTPCRRNCRAPIRGDAVMSVTLRFCGAARTVTGSCYLFETRARTLPRRLRAVSGARKH